MDPALHDLISQALNTIIQALVVAVIGVFTVLGKRIADKYSVTLSDQQQAAIVSLAKQAAYYVEELAAKQERPVSGEQKLNTAIRYMQQARKGLSSTDATRAIHAALGGIAGLGASKKTGT